MPGDATTSTKRNPAAEPVGYLSGVYPGPVSARLKALSQSRAAPQQTLPLLPPSHARGRICEQVWLEEELFHVTTGEALFAVAEEDYKAAAADPSSGQPTPPLHGRLGEQLLLRELNSTALVAGRKIRIADAELELIGTATCTIATSTAPPENQTHSTISIYVLRITEPGLVEPGAPLALL